MYPFSIQFATCKIELTSHTAQAAEGAAAPSLTYRPDLKRDSENPARGLVMVVDETRLNRHRIFALGSAVPVSLRVRADASPGC